MTNTMLLLALLVLAMMTSAVSAQQRTYYDASGKVVGRSAPDSGGTVTNYDARGNVISREAKAKARRPSMMRAVGTSDGSRQTAK